MSGCTNTVRDLRSEELDYDRRSTSLRYLQRFPGGHFVALFKDPARAQRIDGLPLLAATDEFCNSSSSRSQRKTCAR